MSCRSLSVSCPNANSSVSNDWILFLRCSDHYAVDERVFELR